LWDGVPDERLAAIKLVTSGDAYEARRDCYMMSNSFAFGGNNVSLIIKRSAASAAGKNQ
jgi:3-oxoacyl-[acyl-carrier-protein] synthase-1